MAVVAELNRLLQIGLEGTQFTPQAASKQLQTLHVVPDIKATADQFTPSGYQAPTVSVISKDWTETKATGKPSYGELPYLLAFLLGTPTPTTPGGGVLSRQWQWIWYGNQLDTPTPFTIENGNAAQCDVIPGNVASQVGLTFDRAKADQSATFLGGQTNGSGSLTAITGTSEVQRITLSATGGTFTASFRGQTTSAITASVSLPTAATVQTALRALSTIGATGVTVTGVDGGPYDVTFGGVLGLQPVDLLTTDASSLTGGSHTATVTRITPGVSITPETTAIPLAPKDIDVFCDASASAIGSTQFTQTFVGALDWSGKYGPEWPLNSSLLSFGADVPLAPKTMLNLTLATDAQGASLLAAIRANTRQFVRVRWTGPLIEGAIHYQCTVDAAVDLAGVGPTVVVDGVHCRKFSGVIVHDDGFGKAAQITVVNKLLAL